MTPFFLFSPHPMTPFFHFCIKFYLKNANFCALCAHFEKFNDFCGNFYRKFANFALKLHFCTLNDPQFWESMKKPPFFWCPHRMRPFFRRNLTPNAPYFRSPVGTCTSLSYLSAPGFRPLLPCVHFQHEKFLLPSEYRIGRFSFSFSVQCHSNVLFLTGNWNTNNILARWLFW